MKVELETLTVGTIFEFEGEIHILSETRDKNLPVTVFLTGKSRGEIIILGAKFLVTQLEGAEIIIPEKDEGEEINLPSCDPLDFVDNEHYEFFWDSGELKMRDRPSSIYNCGKVYTFDSVTEASRLTLENTIRENEIDAEKYYIWK